MRRWIALLVVAASVLMGFGGPRTPPTAAAATAFIPPDAACQVVYTITSQWDTGFSARVEIRNYSAARNGWASLLSLTPESSATSRTARSMSSCCQESIWLSAW